MFVHERCLRSAYQISICKRKGLERSYNTSFIILRIAHVVWTGVAVFPCEVSRPVEGIVFTACSKYETASERLFPLLVFQVAAPAGTTTRRASSYRALTPPTTPALTTTSPTATSGSTPCACPRADLCEGRRVSQSDGGKKRRLRMSYGISDTCEALLGPLMIKSNHATRVLQTPPPFEWKSRCIHNTVRGHPLLLIFLWERKVWY